MVHTEIVTDHVEEGEVLLLLDEVAKLTPLSFVGVDTGWVLSLAMSRISEISRT